MKKRRNLRGMIKTYLPNLVLAALTAAALVCTVPLMGCWDENVLDVKVPNNPDISSITDDPTKIVNPFPTTTVPTTDVTDRQFPIVATPVTDPEGTGITVGDGTNFTLIGNPSEGVTNPTGNMTVVNPPGNSSDEKPGHTNHNWQFVEGNYAKHQCKNGGEWEAHSWGDTVGGVVHQCTGCGATLRHIWEKTDGGAGHRCIVGGELQAHNWAAMDDGANHKCTVCGGTQAHAFETKSNADTHWSQCTGCGYKKDATAHTIKTKAGLPVTFEGTDEGGDSIHWQECTGCEERLKLHKPTLVGHYDEKDHWDVCAETSCTYVTDKIAHTWSTDWSVDKDKNTHYHACSGCDARKDESAHRIVTKYGSSGHWQACEDCGWRTGEVTPHTPAARYNGEGHWNGCEYCDYGIEGIVAHTLVTNHNAYSHWIECAFCDYEKLGEAHTIKTDPTTGLPVTVEGTDEDGNSIHWQECTGCAERLKIHIPSLVKEYDEKDHWDVCAETGCTYVTDKTAHTKVQRYNETGHWEACTGCDWRTEVTSHSLTAHVDETGHWEECTVCGYKTEPRNHSWADEWSYDNEGHWHVCTIGGCDKTTGHESHNYDNPDYTCVCGHSRPFGPTD